ncbi:MAG: hypothetical protein CVU64_13455 [Deltaproteobacteria bacterium HGW-Deltaproteobacteria-21]|nr:MAG: hypothetical protein CVU64_13455 [Deltaproteobacteria bacterium HGW-Deltaproteobacteria-21]
MKSKWTKAMVALGFSLFLMISACDQGGGGGQEERGGAPGVVPEQRTDRPAPGTQPPPAGQTQRPGGPSGEREGFSTDEPKPPGGTERPETTPQRPPAS